jgi:hypothetical protein
VNSPANSILAKLYSPKTVSATDRESLMLTYTLATRPTIGSAMVDANTGVITYSVPGYTKLASDTLLI